MIDAVMSGDNTKPNVFTWMDLVEVERPILITIYLQN